MTSTTVSSANAFILQVSKSSSKAEQVAGNLQAKTWQQETTPRDSFSDLMKKQEKVCDKQTLQNDEIRTKSEVQPVTGHVQSCKEESMVLSEEGTVQTEAVCNTQEEASELSPEDVKMLAEEAIAWIAVQLGVSQQEVTEAMETMEMLPEDLMNAESVKGLLMTLSHVEDEVSLLLDDELYAQMKEIIVHLEEEKVNWMQQKDANVSPESLQQNIGDEPVMSAQAWMESDEEQMVEAGQLPGKVMNNVQGMQEDPESVQPQEMEQVEEVTTLQKESLAGNGNDSMQQDGTEQDDAKDDKTLMDSAYLRGQTYANAEVLSQEVIARLQGTMQDKGLSQAESIMNQISHYMELQVKPEMSVIEMQLQPESLGTVHLQVSAKEGVITASFVAESEVAKNAIESQVVYLQSKLEEQGIRVEAVEVTLAGHAFERELDQGNERQQERSLEEQVTGTKRVQIDLSKELEELREEDEVMVDMMRKSGNTVNYSA